MEPSDRSWVSFVNSPLFNMITLLNCFLNVLTRLLKIAEPDPLLENCLQCSSQTFIYLYDCFCVCKTGVMR